MSGTLTARLDRAMGAAAPEWVHLLPLGEITGRDGRSFVLDDPARVVAAFRAGAIDLPVDFEHQSETAARDRAGPVPAAGWIKELQVRADGIWGRVEWTARAREMIAAKEYRYVSPVIVYGARDRRVIRLKGAGLVHHPNLHLTALASQEEPRMDPEDILARLAALLKLPPEAAPDEIMAALEKALAEPDPRRFVPVEVLAEVLRDRNARTSAMSERDAALKVGHALDRGFLTPALTDWATALCRQDPASFDAFLAKATPAYASVHQSFRHMAAFGPADEAGRGSAEAEAVCRQLGLPAGTLAD